MRRLLAAQTPHVPRTGDKTCAMTRRNRCVARRADHHEVLRTIKIAHREVPVIDAEALHGAGQMGEPEDFGASSATTTSESCERQDLGEGTTRYVSTRKRTRTTLVEDRLAIPRADTRSAPPSPEHSDTHVRSAYHRAEASGPCPRPGDRRMPHGSNGNTPSNARRTWRSSSQHETMLPAYAHEKQLNGTAARNTGVAFCARRW